MCHVLPPTRQCGLPGHLSHVLVLLPRASTTPVSPPRFTRGLRVVTMARRDQTGVGVMDKTQFLVSSKKEITEYINTMTNTMTMFVLVYLSGLFALFNCIL